MFRFNQRIPDITCKRAPISSTYHLLLFCYQSQELLQPPDRQHIRLELSKVFKNMRREIMTSKLVGFYPPSKPGFLKAYPKCPSSQAT